MSRPRKWGSDAERMAAKRRVNEQPDGVNEQVVASKRTPAPVNEHEQAPPVTVAGLTPVRHQPHVPLSIFSGRGSPRTYHGQSYVLIARSAPALVAGQYAEDAYAVIPATDWAARLDQRCAHGLQGWACHAC